jgi:hypothetical protein
MTASKVRGVYVYVQSYLGEDFYIYMRIHPIIFCSYIIKIFVDIHTHVFIYLYTLALTLTLKPFLAFHLALTVVRSLFVQVYMTCLRYEKTSAVVEKLRKCIGLPFHLYNKEINLKEIFNGDSDSIEEIGGTAYDRSVSQEIPYRRKTTEVEAFISEGVKSIQTIEDDSHNSLEETISTYPLSMVLIRDKMAAGVITKNMQAETYPFFYAEALTAIENVWNIGIQLFSPEDLVWLTGGTDKIKSMPVSVFSFTLLGSCVKVCDPELFSGPFISYVKEDDDYDAVVKRLGVTTGEPEADWNAYRYIFICIHI